MHLVRRLLACPMNYYYCNYFYLKVSSRCQWFLISFMRFRLKYPYRLLFASLSGLATACHRIILLGHRLLLCLRAELYLHAMIHNTNTLFGFTTPILCGFQFVDLNHHFCYSYLDVANLVQFRCLIHLSSLLSIEN